MPITIPSYGVLRQAFAPSNQIQEHTGEAVSLQRTKYQAREELYTSWSAVDDARNKTAKLSDAAVKEFDKASSKAQAKAGKIELYSPKYYAACTFGGMLACVRRYHLCG